MLARIKQIMQNMLIPEMALTKENLLTHFKGMAKRDLRPLWETIAIALDEWRQAHDSEMKKGDLAEELSDLRWNGCKKYEEYTVEELLQHFWDEVVENSEAQTMDQLLEDCDVLQ